MTDVNKRRRGSEIVNQGYFLGDTSGRTKSLNEKSTFAICSVNFGYAVQFESSEKKKVFIKLKNKYNKLGEEKIKTIMHAVNIYYATKGFVEDFPGFYLCCDGFNTMALSKEVQRLFGEKWNNKKFKFKSSLKEMFSKHNLADKYAGEVNKGSKRAEFKLKESHFRKLKLL